MNPSNPFELLGLPLRFDLSKTDLDARLRELSKVLHPDRHASGSAGDRRLALNRAISMNEAVRTLRDPVARGHALLAALQPSARPEEARVDQTFLFELMQLREELTGAHQAGDWATVSTMGKRARDGFDASIEHLRRLFAELYVGAEGEPSRGVAAALSELAKLKYWQRLMEEVGRIEAEQD